MDMKNVCGKSVFLLKGMQNSIQMTLKWWRAQIIRSCIFPELCLKIFPETDRLVLMTPSAEKISVEDTIAETENWLESIGKADEVNLSTELGIDLWGSEGELREGGGTRLIWSLFCSPFL